MLERILSSRVRARVMAALFLSPGDGHTAWELSRNLNENYSAVWKEVNRLEDLGILTSDPQGRARIFRVNSACPIAPELRAIVVKTMGIDHSIRQALVEGGQVQEAFIYGSFASGTADQDSDLDLMIIGDIRLELLAPLISRIEKELNRPVNYSLFTEKEWKEKLADNDPFAKNVSQSPQIRLIGENHAA